MAQGGHSQLKRGPQRPRVMIALQPLPVALQSERGGACSFAGARTVSCNVVGLGFKWDGLGAGMGNRWAGRRARNGGGRRHMKNSLEE